ncbi:MAG: ZIP family metal transporter [Elusimicrobia bacterium]|nr:ZIP family metal transporter [Elusimicrobiota bacterium]
MAATWLWAITSLVLVSLLSLMGVFTLSLQEERLREILFLLVSFAVGALFGDAFIHILPEAFKTLGPGPATGFWVLLGILIFFIGEKFIRWGQGSAFAKPARVKPLVPLILIVDGAHNFIDGMLIGASYGVSIPIGITTTLAVVFHEVPHEIGDFAILVHGGLSVRRALLCNFLSALTAILGGVVALLLGPVLQGFSDVILPITAGGFIYIAGSDLVPELQEKVSLSSAFWHSLLIAAGVGFMALLLLVG